MRILLFIACVCYALAVYSQEDPSITAKLKEKYGDARYVDKVNEEACPPYYSITVGDYPNWQYGICDVNGKEIVPPKYKIAYYGTGGGHYAVVDKNDHYGAYSLSGKLIILPRYKSLYKDEGVFWVTMDVNGTEKKGIIDNKGKVIVSPDKYGSILTVYDDFYMTFSLGYDKEGTKQGILDKQTGKEIIPCIYDDVSYNKNENFWEIEKYGIIDKYGKDKKEGILGRDGKVIIPCEYYNLRIYKDSIGNAIVGVNANKNGTLQFVLLDFNGKILTPKYDFIGDFKENLFICNIGGNCKTESYDNEIGGKWGYINIKGEVVIPLKYDMATDFKDGVAQISLDGVNQILTHPLHGTTLQLANGGSANKVDTNIPETGRNVENTFAFIFANENYAHFSGGDFSINDGKVFKEYCSKTIGLPEKNIRYYEDATFGNFVSAIKKIQDIADVYDGEAKIIVYYSGLGTADNNNISYILPIDASPDALSNTGFNLQDFIKVMNSLNTVSTLVILDAPFSGVDKSGKMLAQHRGVALKAKPVSVSGNTILCVSSTDTETARSDKKYGHSLYTYALLEKLQSSKGECSIKDAVDYATSWVRRESMNNYDAKQTPQTMVPENKKDVWNNLKW